MKAKEKQKKQRKDGGEGGECLKNQVLLKTDRNRVLARGKEVKGNVL